MRLFVLSLCLGAAVAQLSVEDFTSAVRPLSGPGFLRRIARECRQPLDQFGYCMVGRNPNGSPAEPETAVGRRIAAKGERTMDRIRRDDEVQELERIGERVDQCFASCPLTPVKAVKCFLDFIINGGPYDRVKQCVESSWGTGSVTDEPPKFGDLSHLEKDLKLFAGIGLYKRLFANHDKFWEKYGDQVNNMCPGNGLNVRRCIDRAVGYPNSSPLQLDLQRILEGSGAEDTMLASNEDLVQRLSVFGNAYDVKIFLSLVQYRLMGCGLDLFDENDGLRGVIRVIKSGDPCSIPKCIHYVWTIKDTLCNDCRTSLSLNGVDPFQDVRGFLESVADEFVDAVVARNRGRGRGQCKARDPTVCSGCATAAQTWKRDGTNVLQGFESEAIVVTKLLKDVCDMGGGNAAITEGQCSY